MRTPQLAKQSTDDAIGIGWHLRTIGSLRAASHGGTLGGHILLLEIIPERNFAIAILTNANSGWRLIQDVEREALKAYTGATFPMNHAIAHRGLVETLPAVTPLAAQPDPAPYVGRYIRPSNAVVVRADKGRLVVQRYADRVLWSRSRRDYGRFRSRSDHRVRAQRRRPNRVGSGRGADCEEGGTLTPTSSR
jgi:hypothetical protein